jgi:hypothetical protein
VVPILQENDNLFVVERGERLDLLVHHNRSK